MVCAPRSGEYPGQSNQSVAPATPPDPKRPSELITRFRGMRLPVMMMSG